jgi:hypothetical protein
MVEANFLKTIASPQDQLEHTDCKCNSHEISNNCFYLMIGLLLLVSILSTQK